MKWFKKLKLPRMMILFILAVIASVMISITVFLFFIKTTIVQFDMTNTVNSFTQQLQTQNLSTEQVKVITKKFNTALSNSLDSYAQTHHALIFVAPAVVSGAKDITSTIEQSVAAKMRG